MKILKIPVEKWRKNPNGFAYYCFEPSEWLIKLDIEEIQEIPTNQKFITNIEDFF